VPVKSDFYGIGFDPFMNAPEFQEISEKKEEFVVCNCFTENVEKIHVL